MSDLGYKDCYTVQRSFDGGSTWYDCCSYVSSRRAIACFGSRQSSGQVVRLLPSDFAPPPYFFSGLVDDSDVRGAHFPSAGAARAGRLPLSGRHNSAVADGKKKWVAPSLIKSIFYRFLGGDK